MKSSFLRRTLALALALSLAACGGKATFTVGGSIGNLVYDNLVLSNNGVDLAVAAKSTTFAFPNTIDYGTSYAVTVKHQPDHQSCAPINGADTAGRLASIQIAIACSINTAALSGTVKGLTGPGLQLINGSGGIATVVPTTDGTDAAFTFAPVAFGDSYGITVLKQPDGGTQTCTVSPNGTGVMGDAAVTTVLVTCTTK